MRLLIAAVVLTAGTAHAAPVTEHIRAQLLGLLPAGTDVAKVHLPASLEKLDVDASAVTIEVPRALRIGRRSIKVTVRGKRAVFVPITIGELADVAIAEHALVAGTTITADDVRFETRAVDSAPIAMATAVVGSRVTRAIGAGATIEAGSITLPPPVARGTHVTVELRRGRVRARSSGTLELVARRGESATVRLTQSKTIVRGTLVGPATVIVGETP